VPPEYVKGGEITLNISPNAVHKLQMGNELIEFSARFGGVARQISVPVTSVYALYARETGHGMTFDVEGGGVGSKPSVQAKGEGEPVSANTKPPAALPAPVPEPPKKPSGGGKPTLRRIK
jgi:stringent starvation protein B